MSSAERHTSSHGVLVSCRVRDVGLSPDAAAVRVDEDAASVIVTQRSSAPSADAPSGAAASASTGSGAPATSTSCAFLDAVFPPAATQAQVFASVGAPFVSDVLAGYNCTILAYGQTGSGKTHTTVGGTSPEAHGLIPRALTMLQEQTLALAAGGEFDAALTASFVEIYHEKLRDLLLPLNSARLRLREDKARGVWVEGATSVSIDRVETGLALLARGAAHRSTGCTAMNAASSRSHSVLLLTFTKRRTGATARGSGASLGSSSSTMSIVDLAGSERAQKTSASGARLDEAKHINKSLSALGNVINALADAKTRHVPYRDSVLTRLLQNSLGGNAKTHLLLTCSSSAAHADETLSTLRFGARAKRVSNSPHVNVLADDAAGAGTLRESQILLQTLREKVESLSCYIRELEASRCSSCRQSPAEADKPMDNATCRCDSGAQGSSCRSLERSTREHARETDPSDSTDGLKGHDSASLAFGECGGIENDVLQAEMRSLRKALAGLAASTTRDWSQPVVDVSLSWPAPTAVDDASATRRVAELTALVDRLTRENERLNAANSAFSAEIGRLEAALRQRDEGDAAETEILRRRLEATETRLERLQAEHAAALVVRDECRVLLVAKQHEADDLEAQLQQRSILDTGECESHVDATLRQQQKASARPFTADDLASPVRRRPPKPRSEPGEHGAQSGAGLRIQSWWSGDAASDRSSPASLEPLGVVKRCGSSTEAVRPLRTRLVGLLASLEEETSAFRGLLATETTTCSVGPDYVKYGTLLTVSTQPDLSSPTRTAEQSGVTRWYHEDLQTASATSNKGLFTESVAFNTTGVYYVQASAKVDQDWAAQVAGSSAPSPNVKPQTHVVNARTNDEWSFANSGRTVTGRTTWTSPIIAITVA